MNGCSLTTCKHLSKKSLDFGMAFDQTGLATTLRVSFVRTLDFANIPTADIPNELNIHAFEAKLGSYVGEERLSEFSSDIFVTKIPSKMQFAN